MKIFLDSTHFPPNAYFMPQTSLSAELQDKLQLSALEACANNGYNPFEELVQIAQEKEEVIVKGVKHYIHTATKDQRIKIAKEISSYLAPKVKNAEGSKRDFEFHIHMTQFGDNSQPPVIAGARNVTPKVQPLDS